jgi:hypothetical protein
MTDPHHLPAAGARRYDQRDQTPADADLSDYRDNASGDSPRVVSRRDPKRLSRAGESKYVPAASPAPAARQRDPAETTEPRPADPIEQDVIAEGGEQHQQQSEAEADANAPVVWTGDAVRGLGMTTDVETAGAILGVGRTKAYELARTGQFPVKVLRIGKRYLVPVPAILRLLDLE